MPLDTPVSVGRLEEISRQAKDRFRKWHVEALLNQAAVLLDRCIRDRAEYCELLGRRALLDLEIKQAQAAQEIVERPEYRRMLQAPSARLRMEAAYRTLRPGETDNLGWHYDQWWQNMEERGHLPTSREKCSVKVQIHTNDLERMVAEHKRDAASLDLEFQRQRILDSRRILDEKIAAASPGGALYFQERIDHLAARITDDLEDACGRLVIASEGLKVFYGYDTPYAGRGELETSVRWVRAAIRWLEAFGQLDQASTKIYSVRQLVSEESWREVVGSDARSASVTFVLPASDFRSHSFVRLRGVSVFLRSNLQLPSPWAACVHVPSEAVATQNDRTVRIDQREAPPCIVGRVESRLATRAPEVAGLVSLMNVSPISDPEGDGSWRMTITCPGLEVSLSDLEDIELELNLVGIPRIEQDSQWTTQAQFV
jgi:hypothetical protein